MNPEGELNPHIIRIKQQLRKASSFVWEKPDFPEAHRPNIDQLSSHIKIGVSFPPLQLHPALKPEIQAEGRGIIINKLTEQIPGNVTCYNFSTRDLSFGIDTVEFSDFELGRVVYLQAGIDMLNRPSPIPHNEYTDAQREKITFILQDAFNPPPIIEQTEIVKPGFREYLLVDGLYGVEVGPPKSRLMDQMYPTAFAIITDQILRRGGAIEYFDDFAFRGRLQPVSEEDHPNFANILFIALRYINWRYLLDALKSGDMYQAVGIINTYANKLPFRGVNAGAATFMELLKAMEADEQNLAIEANTQRQKEADLN